MSRWYAGFIHLLISLLIVGSVAAYVIYFWYPIPLLPMAKADELLMMVGGIDLIVGPLLTLIVYKQGKKTLKMDLTVISFIQIGFLSLGLYTLFESRPVYIVATDKIFNLVFANEILDEDRFKASPQYQTLTMTSPRLVGAIMPHDNQEAARIVLSALSGGSDLQHMPQYYVDYQQLTPKILVNALPLVANQQISAHQIEILGHIAKKYGYERDAVRFMHLRSSRGFATMLIDAKTGLPITPVNLDF